MVVSRVGKEPSCADRRNLGTQVQGCLAGDVLADIMPRPYVACTQVDNCVTEIDVSLASQMSVLIWKLSSTPIFKAMA